MRYALRRTVAPVMEIMTLQEAKDHLRVDHADDDSYIEPLLTAVRMYLEDVTNRAYVTQTLELTADGFPNSYCFELPRAPLIAVSSIAYIDTAGASQTWSSALYIVDAKSMPGRVTPVYGEVWPVTQARINAVTVTYTAGFGAVPERDLPADYRVLAKLLLTHWYEQRAPIVPGQPMAELPFALGALIEKTRTRAMSDWGW